MKYLDEYFRRGYAPIPVRIGTKRPLHTGWPEMEVTPEMFTEPCNVGLRLGARSGGLVDVDLDCPEAVRVAAYILPATRMISGRAGNPGSHWWYKVEDPPKKLDFEGLAELRGNDHQTVVPPSLHESGDVIEWVQFEEPTVLPIADLKRSVATMAACTMLARCWPEQGRRQDAALALAGGLLRTGVSETEVERLLQAVCVAAGDWGELDKRQATIKRTADKIKAGEETTGWPRLRAIIGDAAVTKATEWLGLNRNEEPVFRKFNSGRRLAEEYLAKFYPGGHLRHWREDFWGWDGRRYNLLNSDVLDSQLWLFVQGQFDVYYRGLKDEDAKKRPAPDVSTKVIAETYKHLKAICMVEPITEMPAWLGDGDNRRYVAFDNGLVNENALLAGDPKVEPHTPLWFSPVCLPYAFIPDAACPKWLAHVNKVLEGDAERIALLQEWFGYNLIHGAAFEKFMLFIGDGANGKSVVCAALKAVLGKENVSSIPLEDLNKPFRLYLTHGKLANIAPEIDEHDKAAMKILKLCVSGETVVVERKYREAFNADATARMTFASNFRPQFSDRSEGLWRRLCLIDFNVKITPVDCIPGMNKAEWWQDSGELPGMFLWAMQGLRRLRKQNAFTIPAASRTAIQEYRLDCNTAAQFLQEQCVTADFASDPTAWVARRQLYDRYVAWCPHRSFALGLANFGKEVLKLPGVQLFRPRVGAKQIEAYRGLRYA